MPEPDATDWYNLPRYYDMVFQDGTRTEARFLDTVAKRYGLRGRSLLEPACGSGRLLLEMARRGWSVTGFDINERMVAYATRRLRRVKSRHRVFRADMARFATARKFDLAHCLVSTFKYLRTEEAARAHLRSVQRALKPGGLYVLGFHLTDYADRSFSRERWVARRGKTNVTSNLQVWPAHRTSRRERVRNRLRVEEPAGVRVYETEWEFRTYSVRQVNRLLQSVPGLEHVATYDFGYDQPRPFDGQRLDAVLVLRRR